MDDVELIELIRIGDDDALLFVIETYSKLLWVIVGGILNNVGTREDIEECISDTYASLWKKANTYDPLKGSLRTFLAIIAKRKALDQYRKLAKSIAIELDDDFESADNDLLEHVIKGELIDELYEAVSLLSEPDKEILVRRFFFEEKPSTISNNTHIPVKEVKNRLYQSKLRLRKILSEREDFDYGTQLNNQD